jgi:hypothetical protein
MKFNKSIFEGRTESIVLPEGNYIQEASAVILQRAAELPSLFNWTPHYFSSETLAETGCLELIVAFCVVAIVLIATNFLYLPREQNLKNFLSQHRVGVTGLLICLGTSLLIPLCSTTHIRGHRLFGFYFCLSLLIFCFCDVAIKSQRLYWVRCLFSFAMLSFVIWHTMVRVDQVLHWVPEKRFTPASSAEMLDTFLNVDGKAYVAEKNASEYRGFYCDQSDQPIWEHFWNAALYVTRLGCDLKLSSLYSRCGCEGTENGCNDCERICFTRTGSESSGYTLRIWSKTGQPIELPIRFYSTNDRPSRLAFVNAQRKLGLAFDTTAPGRSP